MIRVFPKSICVFYLATAMGVFQAFLRKWAFPERIMGVAQENFSGGSAPGPPTFAAEYDLPSLPSFATAQRLYRGLRLFKVFRFNGPNRFLFTMDVKSLYTCIPHADGLIALKFFLEQRLKQYPPTNTLLRLAELVLTTNTFFFNGSFYLQTSGVAMGSKLGPSYACLFIGYQEYLIMNSYHGPFPCLIRRYMDDIIGATSLPLESLQEFINYTNNFHPALQFTHNITEDSLPFLDLRLTIKDDTISTTIYYKETDAHSFLD